MSWMQFSTDVETYPPSLVEDMACDMFIAAIFLSLLPKLPIVRSVHVRSSLASSTQTQQQ